MSTGGKSINCSYQMQYRNGRKRDYR